MSFMRKSLPQTVKVCGGKYEIKKMPWGAFLNALEAIETAPGAIMQAIWPGKKVDDILNEMKSLDEQMLVRLITGALGTAAPMLLAMLAELSGIPEDALRDDPAIGPAGLVEIVKAVWSINDLGNVGAALSELWSSKAPRTMMRGFKG